jgi:heterodisulfide reductase subunit A2
MNKKHVLIIGAGVAGMQAALRLAEAGVKAHLVERESLIGGQTIKFEEVYPNMECATCMVSPIQQDILQHKDIDLHLLSELKKLEGNAGRYTATIQKKARYISLTDCIGCGACYDPCPVSLDNSFEESMAKKKAIYVPCAGALPNVPAIDPEHCLRLNGTNPDCKACQDACVFDAVNFTEEDQVIKVEVAAVLVATGFGMFDVAPLKAFGYGKIPDVYTSMEFERLYAQNGPTEGELILRQKDRELFTVGIIHCVGREEQGYCSGVCCMNSIKFANFLKHKNPNINVHQFYKDLCIPGKSQQPFYTKIKNLDVDFVRSSSIKVSNDNGTPLIEYSNGSGQKNSLAVDMVILSEAMIPQGDVGRLAKILGLSLDDRGFFATRSDRLSPVTTEKDGIYVVGCAEGPKNIPESIAQSEAAVGKILSDFR